MNTPECIKNLYYISVPDSALGQFPGKVKQGPHMLTKKPLTLDRTRDDYYGEKAFVYDKKNIGTDKANAELAGVRKILEGKKGKVLDIPCGTGRFFSLFEELGLDFQGMDVSTDMMNIAKGKGYPDKVWPGDILNIKADDDEFECSICIRLLEKMTQEEMAEAIKELGRVTKYTMAVSLITGPKQETRNRSLVHSEDAFKKAVADAGYQIVARYPIREPEMWVWHLEAN